MSIVTAKPGAPGQTDLRRVAALLVGFLVGLTITVQGGHAPDIAYHATILPLLVVSLILLLWTGRSA